MYQEQRDHNHRKIDHPVYRGFVLAITITCRSRTLESVMGSGCELGVKWKSENRGRRIDGEGDRGGSENVTNRVGGIELWSIEEGGQGEVIVCFTKVSENDQECGKDMEDVHDDGIGGWL